MHKIWKSIFSLVLSYNLLILEIDGRPAGGDDHNSNYVQLIPSIHQSPYIETAVKETESLLSKKDTVYTGLHEFFANTFQYKPIVDITPEEKKYGNSGDKFNKLGRFAVDKVEGLATLVNSAIDIPVQGFKIVLAKTNEKLNLLGGKIVGIARK